MRVFNRMQKMKHIHISTAKVSIATIYVMKRHKKKQGKTLHH